MADNFALTTWQSAEFADKRIIAVFKTGGVGKRANQLKRGKNNFFCLKSATNNLSSRDSHYGVLYGLTN